MSAAIEDRNRRGLPAVAAAAGRRARHRAPASAPSRVRRHDKRSVRTDITDRTGRPLVSLTFGTVFNDKEAFRAAVTGISELSVRLVITVGPDCDPGAFGPQPPPRRRRALHPADGASSWCEVVVFHGGSGTVLAALAMGIPQLCLPQAADQFLNAPAVGRAAAGLAI